MTSAANHKNTRKKYFDAPFSQLFVDLKEPKSKPKPKPEALAKAKVGPSHGYGQAKSDRAIKEEQAEHSRVNNRQPASQPSKPKLKAKRTKNQQKTPAARGAERYWFFKEALMRAERERLDWIGSGRERS